MSVIIGSARISENGTSGWDGKAKAGDQTKKEVSTQNWYLHSKGWVVLRAKNKDAREKIARDMQYACDNDLIGYDQSERDTLWGVASKVGFDCSKVTVKCETDCSALVRVCVNYAGISLGNIRTADMVTKMMATGAFEKLTDKKYTESSDYLLRGDVLVTRTTGHTVVCLTNGAKVNNEVKATGQAKAFDKKYAGTYTVTASWLNIRNGAGVLAKVLAKIPKGTKVYTYGYYTMIGNTPWFYSEIYYNGIKYTAFVSSKYLEKK